jgi:hypothetical protein
VSRDLRVATADTVAGCLPHSGEEVRAEGVCRSAAALDGVDYPRERRGHNFIRNGVIRRGGFARELAGEAPGSRRVALAEQGIGTGIARANRVEDLRVAGRHPRAR